MRKGASGTDFTLEGIKGDYLANIDPDKASVVVTWDKWIMEGTAVTNNGTFPVQLRMDGRQEYELIEMTETTMGVALKRDAVNATVTFAGMTVSDQEVDIPKFSGGSWICNVDNLTLISDDHTWNFERAN